MTNADCRDVVLGRKFKENNRWTVTLIESRDGSPVLDEVCQPGRVVEEVDPLSGDYNIQHLFQPYRGVMVMGAMAENGRARCIHYFDRHISAGQGDVINCRFNIRQEIT